MVQRRADECFHTCEKRECKAKDSSYLEKSRGSDAWRINFASSCDLRDVPHSNLSVGQSDLNTLFSGLHFKTRQSLHARMCVYTFVPCRAHEIRLNNLYSATRLGNCSASVESPRAFLSLSFLSCPAVFVYATCVMQLSSYVKRFVTCDLPFNVMTAFTNLCLNLASYGFICLN